MLSKVRIQQLAIRISTSRDAISIAQNLGFIRIRSFSRSLTFQVSFVFKEVHSFKYFSHFKDLIHFRADLRTYHASHYSLNRIDLIRETLSCKHSFISEHTFQGIFFHSFQAFIQLQAFIKHHQFCPQLGFIRLQDSFITSCFDFSFISIKVHFILLKYVNFGRRACQNFG